MENALNKKNLPAKLCFSHIGGKLGQLLLDTFIEKGWIKPSDRKGKHFVITEAGKKGFKKMGLDLSQIKEENI
jgi:hypothetical protein